MKNGTQTNINMKDTIMVKQAKKIETPTVATPTPTAEKPKMPDTGKLVNYTSNRGAVYKVPERFAQLPSVSAVIRAMFADGYTKSQIHTVTGMRYQHVRNVLAQPLQSATVPAATTETPADPKAA